MTFRNEEMSGRTSFFSKEFLYKEIEDFIRMSELGDYYTLQDIHGIEIDPERQRDMNSQTLPWPNGHRWDTVCLNAYVEIGCDYEETTDVVINVYIDLDESDITVEMPTQEVKRLHKMAEDYFKEMEDDR